MTEERRRGDRRHETRKPVGGRILWKREGAGSPEAWGLLSDGSDGSISFITQSLNQPSLGERIETQGVGSRKRCYMVTRIAAYDEHDLLLIAGSMIGAARA